MGAVSTNFGSRLYAIYRQFMMAIKTDLAADRAIKALEEGKSRLSCWRAPWSPSGGHRGRPSAWLR